VITTEVRPFRPLGDRAIGVFAPASPFPEARYAAGLEVLTTLGAPIVEAPSLRARRGYLAGSDAERLADLHALLEDPAVGALWAARGGYGVHRLLESLDAERLVAAGKPIVGFSDLTALHAVAQRGGLMSIHGPVITQLGELGVEAARDSLTLLSPTPQPLELVADGPCVAPGRAEGPLLGGCLSVLAPLVGTPHLPPLGGAILLLEDVAESTYRIDRLLTGLRLAGLLGRVAGVALGDFWACRPRSDDEPEVGAVLAERLGDLGVPVLAGLPIGHGPRNRAVPLGARAVLDADARRLTIAWEGAVA
jgi:muramoyltetrapeptide carboxypeptidase